MANLMTPEETADYIRTPLATLRYWRAQGKGGPPAFRLGRRLVYERADVDQWIADRKRAGRNAS